MQQHHDGEQSSLHRVLSFPLQETLHNNSATDFYEIAIDLLSHAFYRSEA